MVKLPIYIDNNATTQVDPLVVETMLPYFTERFGNPGSRHSFGFKAKEAVDCARTQVASVIKAASKEIVFTSGATESNNLALKGAAVASRSKGNHIVTTVTEHKAILDPCKRLEEQGYQITYLTVDEHGQVSVDRIAEALTDKTILVSVMTANNEIGTLHPVQAIGRLCEKRGILFHTDAVQAAGKMALDVNDFCIDLLSMSAHKMYGPKGIGALYVRRRKRDLIVPMIEGGGQEGGLRSGTLAVPNIVGFGKASELCGQQMPQEASRVGHLRDRLYQGIVGLLPGVTCNGHPTERLPGCLSLSFEGVDAGALLMSMKGVALSYGSACTSSNSAPSHVLKAVGLTDELAQGTLRFGVGRFTTGEEIEYVANEVATTVRRFRDMRPLISPLLGQPLA